MQILEKFPVIFQQEVAWGDMDAFNHVNNVQYYRYFESTRIAYLKAIDFIVDNVSTVVASSSCRYLKPIVFPDTLYIGACVEELRNTSMRMKYCIYSKQQQNIVAEGEAVIVCIDIKSQQKLAIPVDVRQRICQIEHECGRNL